MLQVGVLSPFHCTPGERPSPQPQRAAAVFIAPASDTKLKARVLPAPAEVHIAAENTPIAARSH